jgi:hypothetical protein
VRAFLTLRLDRPQTSDDLRNGVGAQRAPASTGRRPRAAGRGAIAEAARMAPTITMRRKPGTERTDTAAPDTRQLDILAHWLDSKFSVLGIRFGVDSVLGLIPGVGDVLGLALSAYLLGQGYRLGARKRTLARMGANVMVDALLGAVPFVGEVFDVVWKANRANMRLLKRDLERPNAMRRT